MYFIEPEQLHGPKRGLWGSLSLCKQILQVISFKPDLGVSYYSSGLILQFGRKFATFQF